MELQADGWAVIELLGHRTRAGRLSEVEIAGTPMLRIDVPVADDAEQEAFVTEYYGGAAVYSICPTNEDVIREQHYGKRLPVRPVRFQEPPALTHDRDDAESASEHNDIIDF